MKINIKISCKFTPLPLIHLLFFLLFYHKRPSHCQMRVYDFAKYMCICMHFLCLCMYFCVYIFFILMFINMGESEKIILYIYLCLYVQWRIFTKFFFLDTESSTSKETVIYQQKGFKKYIFKKPCNTDRWPNKLPVRYIKCYLFFIITKK